MTSSPKLVYGKKFRPDKAMSVPQHGVVPDETKHVVHRTAPRNHHRTETCPLLGLLLAQRRCLSVSYFPSRKECVLYSALPGADMIEEREGWNLYVPKSEQPPCSQDVLMTTASKKTTTTPAPVVAMEEPLVAMEEPLVAMEEPLEAEEVTTTTTPAPVVAMEEPLEADEVTTTTTPAPVVAMEEPLLTKSI
ncbi:uncharacterized protein LOC106177377 [Lingula anatina]|uniref:Uncharacterized protein LOC106177377 n=1 Tax=Lingula anatina TaxID=7574 RepID=A0A1S3JYX5_LINAN|nr:uncharacterized protein LOC106177377 [Lingula anatina]|eukprot:XP_013415588.1 uncharacterized protein LOC106177377 [Lingula anatina]